MKNIYKISIIIPIYNAEDYLEETIMSVINQKGLCFEEDIQLILVNNATLDNSEIICFKYMHKYNNVNYIKLEINNGPSGARNAGLKLAVGETVNFLDADDKWDEYALKKAYEALKANWENVDFVACRVKQFEASDVYEWFDWRFNDGSRIVNIIDSPKYKQCKVTPCLIKGDVARSFKFDERIKHAEDMKYITEILLKKNQYFLERDAVFYYRIRSNGSSLWQGIRQSRNWYIQTLDYCIKYIIDLSKNKYGVVIDYVKTLVQGDFHERFPIQKAEILTEEEFDVYIKKAQEIYLTVDNSIIENDDICIEKKVYGILFKQSKALADKVNGLMGKGLYLFPYENVENGESIYIYGGGRVGQDYLKQLMGNRYCVLKGIIDKNSDDLDLPVPLFDPQHVTVNDEKIIIAIADKKIAKEIIEEYMIEGIKKEKIVWCIRCV